jgi:hypothetical protein
VVVVTYSPPREEGGAREDEAVTSNLAADSLPPRDEYHRPGTSNIQCPRKNGSTMRRAGRDESKGLLQ